MAFCFGVGHSPNFSCRRISGTSASTCTLARHQRKGASSIAASLGSGGNSKSSVEEVQRRREHLRQKKAEIEKLLRKNEEQLRLQESRLAQAKQSVTVTAQKRQGTVTLQLSEHIQASRK